MCISYTMILKQQRAALGKKRLGKAIDNTIGHLIAYKDALNEMTAKPLGNQTWEYGIWKEYDEGKK